MNTLLRYRLEEKMEEWMNENCEDYGVWPRDIWVGGETDKMMAAAAIAVFDAVVEFQQFVKSEGYMEDTT